MALLGVQGHRSVDLDFATNIHKNIKKMLKFAAANEPGGIHIYIYIYIHTYIYIYIYIYILLIAYPYIYI